MRSHSTKHDRLWETPCKGVVNDSNPVNKLVDGKEREREVQWTSYRQITRLAQCCFDRRSLTPPVQMSSRIGVVNKHVTALMNILARRSRHVLTLYAITSFYERLRLASIKRRSLFNSESSCVA